MSAAHEFEVAPWSVAVRGLDVSRLAHRESVFALSNGHIGWRGTLDEGEPHGTQGAYLNGVFEEHPMPYAEDGYGYPNDGQSVVSVPNGQVLRLLVDDEPFDVRNGELHHHEQRLDLRAGVLRRDAHWTSPAGASVRIASTRLVSVEHRSVAAVRFEVEAVDAPVALTVLSEIVADEPQPRMHPDPRVQSVLDRALEDAGAFVLGTAATIVQRTRRSRLGVAVSMDHVVAASGEAPAAVTTEASGGLARTTVQVRLEPGERLDVVKLVGHAWSPSLSVGALRDRAEGAVADARHDGWDALLAAQRSRLDDYWACADVRVDGAPRLQQAVRFALFHVFQASARMELRSVPGKGLTGTGYEGHTFWDFEAFVLPVLTSTAPEAAEQALRWRHSTLHHARERARLLGFAGAAFAWRTIDGRESSGYWPASTAALHVNATIAAAVLHHVRATGNAAFEREVGLEVLVETARLWASVGRWDAEGGFHIDGVTGPDEYSAIVDDNVYTNLLAQRNLDGAAASARRHRDVAEALGVDDAEIAGWTLAAASMSIPFDEALGVHPPFARAHRHARWDFAATGDRYPLHDHFPYFDLYRKQVAKQADLVLALLFAHDAFTLDEKARAFAASEAITVRDSSLSAAPQSAIAAEVGHLDLAADYLAEAATLDLDDLHENTGADGLHIASLAGIWMALTAGFGGMREGDAGLRFAPRLPQQLTRLAFGIRIHGRTLRVDIQPDATVYALAEGPPLSVRHFDEELELHPGRPERAATPPLGDPGPRPEQPAGRAPRDFDAAFTGR